MGEILSNRAFKVGNTRKGSSVDPTPGNLTEEALDLIEPARTRRREVQNKAGMAREPALDLRLLVSRVVVEHEMNGQVGRNVGIDPAKESQELLMPVTSMAGTDDFSRRNIERGEQRCDAVPQVVMRLAFRNAGPHGKNRLRAIQGLNLRFLIHAKHDCTFRWTHV